MDFKQLSVYVVAGLLAWGGITLVGHTGDIESAKTNFEYIKEDIKEIKADVKEVKDILTKGVL